MSPKKDAYRVTTPEPSLAHQRTLNRRDYKLLGMVVSIALAVRLYGLAWPTSVVFDEVHFGGFARKYIIGRFFFDVHPPLAKMLFAVVGWIGGFDGEFDFKNIGDDYIEPGVPYVTMRLLPSLCGIATIMLAYSTLRASGVRSEIATVGSLLLTFENTHATESRYILLDSPLVFFIALTVYAYQKLDNEVPLKRNWFRYLVLTGLGLGATVSSKWVGLFTIAWVGTLTAWQTWWIWGDLSVPVRKFWTQFSARLVILLGVPALFYMVMFWLHFFCVDNVGDGADFMSRAFQSTLKHNKLPGNILADVSYGSEVSLRHFHTNGGYLHSHPSAYETGSKQQQITLYPHVDENNIWRLETENNSTGLIGNGDIIRLMHIETDKRLHSHDHRAPVTTHDYINEVSAYGFPEFEGDPNDNWRVKIVDRESVKGAGRDRLQALRTVFQLEHVTTGCLLYSKNVKLPPWGFEQQEVSCIRQGKGHNTLWFIEQNENPELDDDAERVSYEPPSFWAKFVELNKVMWDVNKGLTEPHAWESRPESWLVLKRGINMWGHHNTQVYLIGNLPIYWAIAGLIAVVVSAKVMLALAWQRKGGPGNGLPYAPVSAVWQVFDHGFGAFALGWFFHFFPSFFMVRQLFLHHYLASVYFGVLMIGQFLELVLNVVKPRLLARAIPVLMLGVSIAWYWWYSPLIYGKRWTRDLCEKSKFFDMDFDCNTFLESYGEYDAMFSDLQRSVYSAKHGLLPAETTETSEVSGSTVRAEGQPVAESEPSPYEHPDVSEEETVASEPAATVDTDAPSEEDAPPAAATPVNAEFGNPQPPEGAEDVEPKATD